MRDHGEHMAAESLKVNSFSPVFRRSTALRAVPTLRLRGPRCRVILRLIGGKHSTYPNALSANELFTFSTTLAPGNPAGRMRQALLRAQIRCNRPLHNCQLGIRQTSQAIRP